MSLDSLLLSILFIVSVLTFFSSSQQSPKPDQPSPSQITPPLPDPWRPSFSDAIVPFIRPKSKVSLSSLSPAEIRKLCHRYKIPCKSRGRISSHVLTQLEKFVA